MWRRVSCEQPLNTSQSILRLRGSLVKSFGAFLNETCQCKAERESGPYSRTWLRNRSDPRIRRGNATRPGDALRSSGKSCLFCISRRGPGILSQGEWVLVLAKSAAVLAASTSARRDLENPGEITADSHQLVPISAAGLQG
jgi:hypothetical protein